MKFQRSLAIAALLAACGSAAAQLAVPATSTNTASTSQTPYMLPSSASSGVRFLSFATALSNEFFRRTGTAVNDYRMVGVPDGQGAYDNNDGTFTLLVNHEITDTQGIVRAHGSRGSFVSKWIINKSDLTVVSAADASNEYRLWNIGSGAYQSFNTANPMPRYVQAGGTTALANQFGTQGWNTANPNSDGISRLCSGDLAPVSAYSFGGLGTTDRIFLSGEERGPSGRVFAHVATGAAAGVSYELPRLGDFSWENAIASPFAQQKTIVAGTDDSTPGQLYFYIGDKQSTGNVVDRAGLTNGSLYGLQIADVGTSSSTFTNFQGTAGTTAPGERRDNVLGTAANPGVVRDTAAFTLYNFGDVTNTPGFSYQTPGSAAVPGLQEIGDANKVVNFLRPEDAAWDTVNSNRMYMVTTDTTTSGGGKSRLFAVDFSDITNPTAGGQVKMLAEAGNAASLSGGISSATAATTFEMADNICVTKQGYVLIQEDVGSNARLGRLWLYDPFGDNMVEIGISDAARFTTGAAGFLTVDEETSGIIDAQDMLGEGWFLLNMQAHYAISGELVEGGQLLAVYIPLSGPNAIPAPGAVGLLGLGGLLAARRRRR